MALCFGIQVDGRASLGRTRKGRHRGLAAGSVAAKAHIIVVCARLARRRQGLARLVIHDIRKAYLDTVRETQQRRIKRRQCF